MYSYKIKKVNGLLGAKAYSLPPNSSVLLMDVELPVIYMVESDIIGQNSVTVLHVKNTDDTAL